MCSPIKCLKRQYETPEECSARLKLHAAQERLRRQHETPEKCAARLEVRDVQESLKILRETREKRVARLEARAAKKRLRILRETPEKRASRLKAHAAQKRLREQLETPEKRADRLKAHAAQKRLREQLETPEKRAARLKAHAAQKKLREQLEPPEKRAARLEVCAAQKRLKRQCETPEERSARLSKERARRKGENLEEFSAKNTKIRILYETPEECSARLRKLAIRDWLKRQSEIPEEYVNISREIAGESGELDIHLELRKTELELRLDWRKMQLLEEWKERKLREKGQAVPGDFKLLLNANEMDGKQSLFATLLKRVGNQDKIVHHDVQILESQDSSNSLSTERCSYHKNRLIDFRVLVHVLKEAKWPNLPVLHTRLKVNNKFLDQLLINSSSPGSVQVTVRKELSQPIATKTRPVGLNSKQVFSSAPSLKHLKISEPVLPQVRPVLGGQMENIVRPIDVVPIMEGQQLCQQQNATPAEYDHTYSKLYSVRASAYVQHDHRYWNQGAIPNKTMCASQLTRPQVAKEKLLRQSPNGIKPLPNPSTASGKLHQPKMKTENISHLQQDIRNGYPFTVVLEKIGRQQSNIVQVKLLPYTWTASDKLHQTKKMENKRWNHSTGEGALPKIVFTTENRQLFNVENNIENFLPVEYSLQHLIKNVKVENEESEEAYLPDVPETTLLVTESQKYEREHQKSIPASTEITRYCRERLFLFRVNALHFKDMIMHRTANH